MVIKWKYLEISVINLKIHEHTDDLVRFIIVKLHIFKDSSKDVPQFPQYSVYQLERELRFLELGF